MLPFENRKREIIEIRKSETGPDHGKYPNERNVEELLEYGILNIDKPSGPTSHQVSAYVQKILRLKKTGHSGTLDPKVTGVLPVALGRSTKIVQTLLTAGKEYVCLMHLHNPVPREKVLATFDEFTGRIKQLPPVKSSVKRQWRYRRIYYYELLEMDDQDVLFRVGCQAGTYIRKLVHDMGEYLQTGAHMAELRRTKAGPFDETLLVTLQDLKDAAYYYNNGLDKPLKSLIQPIENAVRHLPKIWVLDTTVDTLCHGASLAVPGIAKVESLIEKDDIVAIFTLKDELIGYGNATMTSKEMRDLQHGIAVITDKVLMLPGVYRTY